MWNGRPSRLARVWIVLGWTFAAMFAIGAFNALSWGVGAIEGAPETRFIVPSLMLLVGACFGCVTFAYARQVRRVRRFDSN